jgi:hypothetical protein
MRGASAVSLQTYWLVVPLAGLGLSAFGWLALWHRRRKGGTASHGYSGR